MKGVVGEMRADDGPPLVVTRLASDDGERPYTDSLPAGTVGFHWRSTWCLQSGVLDPPPVVKSDASSGSTGPW